MLVKAKKGFKFANEGDCLFVDEERGVNIESRFTSYHLTLKEIELAIKDGELEVVENNPMKNNEAPQVEEEVEELANLIAGYKARMQVTDRGLMSHEIAGIIIAAGYRKRGSNRKPY